MIQVSPYAYAKACGIISKSYIGKRLSFLLGINTLNDLQRLLFPNHYNELTQKDLLIELEKRIIERTVRHIFVIVNTFDNPPDLIIRMLRTYEYNDLKMCIENIVSNKKELPQISDIGKFAKINFNAFPNLNAMIVNTEFENVLSFNPNSPIDINKTELIIDTLHYKGLFESLSKLSLEDKQIITRILSEEISLRNCTYALRLRVFYKIKKSEIKKYLLDINGLDKEAVELLEFNFDSQNDWDNWKWKKLLPKGYSGLVINPKQFQNNASLYLYKLAYNCFRRNPMSIASIFCYIKIKQFEEDILTSITEGLALGIDAKSVFNLLEVV